MNKRKCPRPSREVNLQKVEESSTGMLSTPSSPYSRASASQAQIVGVDHLAVLLRLGESAQGHLVDPNSSPRLDSWKLSGVKQDERTSR